MRPRRNHSAMLGCHFLTRVAKTNGWEAALLDKQFAVL
jgi:hypothetical protein